MPGDITYQPVQTDAINNTGLVGKTFAQHKMQQQPVLSGNEIPNSHIYPDQQTFGQEALLTSEQTIPNNQQMPIGANGFGQQLFIGQSYEIPTNLSNIQAGSVDGFINQIPVSQGFGQFPQGQMLQSGFGMPLNHGFIEFPQGQPGYGLLGSQDFNGRLQDQMKEAKLPDNASPIKDDEDLEREEVPKAQAQPDGPLEGTTQGYYNQGNLGKVSGVNGEVEPADVETPKTTDPADIPVRSKTSMFGPSGGLPRGHHTLRDATNVGYSLRPGYTLGAIESNPTTQANLDTNGGGLFNRPSRERRAEPYSFSNPGTYGIPYGQTIDTASHLRPDVALNRLAPIGMVDRPGYTGYVDDFSDEEVEDVDEEKGRKKHRFSRWFRK